MSRAIDDLLRLSRVTARISRSAMWICGWHCSQSRLQQHVEHIRQAGRESSPVATNVIARCHRLLSNAWKFTGKSATLDQVWGRAA
jgi:hypothetical protein